MSKRRHRNNGDRKTANITNITIDNSINIHLNINIPESGNSDKGTFIDRMEKCVGVVSGSLSWVLLIVSSLFPNTAS